MTNNPNMRVCMQKKKIYLNRRAIALIGNPTHLIFRYDEQGGILYFAPAIPGDLNAYEIPKHFWTGTRKTCEIARIAFLSALQYRLGWEDDSKYYYDGKLIVADGVPMLAYSLPHGIKL